MTRAKAETDSIGFSNVVSSSLKPSFNIVVKPGFHIVVSGLSRSLLNMTFRQKL